MALSDLIAGHDRFKQEFADHREHYARLAQGQEPHVFWIGCSDSRVIPEQIVQAQAGELFVLRLIANVVPPFGVANDAVGAAIEFATLHLSVSDIIICGHTDCRGIQALDASLDHAREAHLARWVEWARSARAQVESSGVAEDRRLLETIKANINYQCQNLLTYPCVRDSVAREQLRVHGWLYDLSTGGLQAFDEKARGWHELGA